ncbi:MAG TPA: GTP cyclohydrolase II [Patescibacteria group bacterium]|nr:GTP cyclohydrolase II [Patescibacteria group bacterium]
MKKNKSGPGHIVLTSHPPRDGKVPKITWGAGTLKERGPIIASMSDHQSSNVIGAYSGAYSVYRAVAVAIGALDPLHVPDLTNTKPAEPIGPFPQWSDPDKIVSLDPWGHMAGDEFEDYRKRGLDVRPTIAVTKAHINMPEIKDAITAGRLKPDGDILTKNGDVKVTKAAIDPVWYLPGIAKRFDIDENDLRRALFEHSGGMFPELVTRPDLKVFLPPIGGHTLYFIGDPATMHDKNVKLACRVHDECNGSDVFGSDICTCRPYLCHGIELCIEMAQQGGNGLIVYNRKEGRALGEVTKFLVYNARKRQEGGDRADQYFRRTECVAGVQDMRFQELMPDIFHWLGITHIHRFASMSDMKYNALAKAGITVGERIEIPPELIPADAAVEMEAKKAAGYFAQTEVKSVDQLKDVKGRGLEE